MEARIERGAANVFNGRSRIAFPTFSSPLRRGAFQMKQKMFLAAPDVEKPSKMVVATTVRKIPQQCGKFRTAPASARLQARCWQAR
jgi:hypothetical protein